MLAVYTILLLITVYMPFISLLSLFFMVFPFLYYSSKYSLNYSIVFFIGSLALSAIFGTFAALPLTIIYGTTGIAMGYCILKKRDIFTAYVVSSLVFLIDTVGYYVVSIVVFHFNFIKDIKDLTLQSVHQYAGVFDAMGQKEAYTKMSDQVTAALKLFETIAPSILLVSSFAAVLIFMAVSFPIARRLGVNIPKWKPFREFQLPRNIIWYYLFTYILLWVLKPSPGTYLYVAIVNLVFLTQILTIIQGISFVFFFAYSQKWAKAVPVMITIFSFLFSPVIYVVGLLGLADLGFNLRKLVGKNHE
jgi:uncharacterized protein YybS (DUF2232 family)